MNRTMAHRILDIQDEFAQNPKYTQLIREYREASVSFREAVESMTQEQKDAMFSYMGLLFETHIGLLEYALTR